MKNKPKVATRCHPARHPLMAKGGVHSQSKSSLRFSSRQQLWDEVDEYLQLQQQKAADEPPSSILRVH